MKYKNFLFRAVNLLLILGVLWQYQQVALVRAAAVSQRKQEIAEVEAYNASVLQAQSAAQAEQSQSGYRDGGQHWHGAGQGKKHGCRCRHRREQLHQWQQCVASFFVHSNSS